MPKPFEQAIGLTKIQTRDLRRLVVQVQAESKQSDSPNESIERYCLLVYFERSLKDWLGFTGSQP